MFCIVDLALASVTCGVLIKKHIYQNIIKTYNLSCLFVISL